MSGVVEHLRGLAGASVDLDGLTSAELCGLFEVIERARQRLDALQAQAALLLQARESKPELGLASVEFELRRLRVADTKRRVASFRALPSMPATTAALAEGSLSHLQVASLVRARELSPDAFVAEEASLVELSANRPLRSFQRDLVQFVRRTNPQAITDSHPERGVQFKERPDGAVEIAGVIEADKAAVIKNALTLEMDRQWREQHPERSDTKIERDPWPSRALDALVALAECSLNAKQPSSGPGRYLLQVLIDYQTLVHGLHAKSICTTVDGIPLSPETVRKLACDADILPIVLGGDGIPIDMGRARRTFTNQQRRALAVLDQTCMFGECTVPITSCQAHHNDDWQNGGVTDLNNGAMFCDRCHQQVHNLRLRVERTNGVLTLYRPDGTIYTQRSFPTLTTPNRELKLTA